MSSAFRNASKRLGDLLLYGWTMLGEACPSPNCNCPLMRSPDGQKYCVNCESWIYPNRKPESKKFDEIISSRNQPNKEQPKKIDKKIEEKKVEEKKDINKNEINNIEKINKANEKEKKEEKNNKHINKDNSVLELVETKLRSLSIDLNEENDIRKCEDILQLMNKLLDFIERYKNIQK